MDEAKFEEIVNKNKPKKKAFKNIFLAFLGGGIIALIFEGVFILCTEYLSISEDETKLICSAVLIMFSVISTFFGFYNDIAQRLGAGIFLPTTGFANSLTSSAMEGRSEGLVTGIGANIFNLAGSVISFGFFIAFYFAMLYYVLNLMGINVWA